MLQQRNTTMHDYMLLAVVPLCLLVQEPTQAQQASLRQTLEGHSGGIVSLAFSPDGKTLASAGVTVFGSAPENNIRLWDSATGKNIRVFEREGFPVRCIAFSPEGKMLAACGDRSELELWDTEKGVVVRRFETGDFGAFETVRFSHDGKMLATGCLGDKTIRLWEVATGKNRLTWKGHERTGVRTVVFSPD